LAQLWKGGSQTQLFAIAGIDTAHQWLYQRFVDLATQAAGHKTTHRFIAGLGCGWDFRFAG
jgi:hypothetical protein